MRALVVVAMLAVVSSGCGTFRAMGETFQTMGEVMANPVKGMQEHPQCAAAMWASAADLGTTEYGLANGAGELNPAMQERGIRYGASAVHAAAVCYGEKRTRSKWLWFAVLPRVAAAGWNVSVIMKLD